MEDISSMKSVFPQQFANIQRDFLQLLKEIEEIISGILLDYKTQQMQGRVLKASRSKMLGLF